MEKLKINKKLLPIKAHYFLVNGAHSGVLPYVPVYAKQLGISASVVGIIYAILSCLTVISRPVIGSIVDRFQKLRLVLIILILIDISADLGLNFIPGPAQLFSNNTSIKLHCHEGESYLIDMSNCGTNIENHTTDCSLSCLLCQSESNVCTEDNSHGYERNSEEFFQSIHSLHYNMSSEKTFIGKCKSISDWKCNETCYAASSYCEPYVEENSLKQICMLSIFIAIISITNGSIVSLSDAACYNVLADQPQNYGKQRMWGTVGWGLFALLTGYLNQVFTGSSDIYNFSAGFYMLVILFVIDLLFIHKHQLKDVRLSRNICKDVGQLLVKVRILAFIISTFFVGMATGMSRSYLFWYFRTTLNANQIALGLVSGIQCFLGELPFFFFSGWIIKKLGHIHTFTMSFAAYGIKFIIHSFMTNPWYALPVEILQGPCFGSFYSAMTSYAKIIAPEGTEATMQGVLSGTFEGLGVAMGSLLGGFAMTVYGGRTTFAWTGIISLVIGALHCLVHTILNRNISHEQHQ